MLPMRTDYGLGVRAQDRLLIERYMTGTLIGCDTLSAAGRHRLLGVNRKCFFAAPSFAVRGGCYVASPATAATPLPTDRAGSRAATISNAAWPLDAEQVLDPRRHGELAQLVFAALDAVGFDWGATHTELMLTDDGPRLVEINARLVGAKLPRLIDRARGGSVLDELIDTLLAARLNATPPPMPTDLPLSAAPRIAAIRWLAADHFGTLAAVVLPEGAVANDCEVLLLKQPGEPVRPPMENADRIGCVITHGATPHEAQARAAAYVDAVQLRVAA
jgi:biotin carboxylase